MRIGDIEVLVCSPGRNLVTVKIVTDKGICRLGDATVNGREMAVAANLTEHGAPDRFFVDMGTPVLADERQSLIEPPTPEPAASRFEE